MNVLLAVDFSEVTDKMLEVLHSFPERASLHAYVLHVVEPDPAFVGWEAGPDVVRDQVAAELRRERRQVEALARGLRADGLKATALLAQGPTVDAVLDQASSVDAAWIVVGSHGHGATYDLVVGSISSGIIRRSQRPVLVVPAARG